MAPTPEKIENLVSLLIGDRIKIDVLILLNDPCREPTEYLDSIFDCEDESNEEYIIPAYSIILNSVNASSGVLTKKLDELEEYELIESKKNSDRYNRRIFRLTDLGKEVADLLIEIDDILEEYFEDEEE